MKERHITFYYSTDSATYGMAISNDDDLKRARTEVYSRFLKEQRKYYNSLERLEQIKKVLGLKE